MQSNMSKSPTATRLIMIMDLIGKKRELNPSEIINLSNIPKTTVYTLLEILSQENLIRKRIDGKYVLGVKLLELGGLAAGSFDIRTETKPFLVELAKKTQMTVQQAILENNEAFYLTKIESPEINRATISCSWEGKRLNFYNTALGKILLAWQPEDIMNKIIENIEFIKKTENTITNKEDLKEELAKVKQQQWAYDNGEDLNELRCLAVPIFNYNNELICAIGVTGLASNFSENNKNIYLQELLNTARKISNLLE
ncbi:hypothetical protein A9G11_07180 [Gilliamella sp. wkB108]|uniref:IclR family transcriptional regulator n=1 Tax=Gilliamella sp. wkB108 TaxID=3120256 RepID=UPI00080DC302|nr:IclR family transcriptional regulator [Gilliamella apicola]OCG22462.1 hypothetical protein A9G11_07180 [Gilliamella apicola]